MKRSLLLLLNLAGFAAAAGVQAQPPAAPLPAAGTKEAAPVDASGTLESDRLMQQYMAKRAELLALRHEAGQQAKTARTDADRKRIQAQLESAERPLSAQAAELARRYREARQQALGANARKSP